MKVKRIYFSGSAGRFYTNYGKNHRANTYLYPKFLRYPIFTRADTVTEYKLSLETFRNFFVYNRSEKRYELRSEGRVYLRDICISQTEHYTDCLRSKLKPDHKI